MKQATIVSLLPIPINEHIHGYIPSDFPINASKNNEPAILTIDNAVYMEYIDDVRGSRRFMVDADKVATELVNNYVSSSMGSEPGIKQPGLFWVPDKVTEIEDDQLDHYKSLQNLWFKTLVEMGDDLWKTYQKHIAVPGICRIAAMNLGMDRSWNIDVSDSVRKCPACMSLVPSSAIVCGTCKLILDHARYEPLRFAGA